jgi:ATP-dependent Lon protease
MPFDTTTFIPLLPIRNAVLVPGVALPIRVGRPKSIAAIQAAKANGNWVVAVTLKVDEEGKDPGPEALYPVGTLAKLEKIRGNGDSGYQVLVRADQRFRIDQAREADGMLQARGETWDDKSDLEPKVYEALLKSLKTMAKEILELLPADTSQLLSLVEGIEDLSYLSFLCAGNLEIPLDKKQALLADESLKTRVLALLELMQQQKSELQVQSEIRDKLSSKMGKLHRDAILRQQLDAIREELGEGDDKSRAESYRKKIEDAGMPEETQKVALDELKRLESIGNGSPEAHVIRNYLDLLCALPWNKGSEASTAGIDLDDASAILERDHYGLEKIKKRILQSLAVMKLKRNGRGPILLFVGPPGVGKTSLGQSIAKALGRKFVRGSLGGVRDDAEIRGHRRTYIGAMPGRIIQGIKRAGENNPVFMLDEIDKLGRGFQGDPASALLEVLDPEQNANFLDHYLDVPFDLSKVVFIATANTLETIPGPLLDRMEVIDLSGYTTAEKLHIAKNHLLPKQLGEHGMTAEELGVADEAMLRLITHYTREAGVRDLQRKIAAVCRAATEKVVRAKGAGKPGKVTIGLSDLEEILGPEKFIHEVAERIAYPGVVTGLAWTPHGGEILFVEASLMPGTGKLILTGQLGDVMKESAQIALSLVRSKLPASLPSFDFDKRDVHIHVPAGAIPKDGPSAGVALLTTIASLFTGKSVSPKLAMTGEVTLRGAVMPVGGIKEKVIAAHRSGIERVILSKRNERDLRDVPEEVRSSMQFELVENVAQVLKIALGIDIAAQPSLGLGSPVSPPPTAAVA